MNSKLGFAVVLIVLTLLSIQVTAVNGSQSMKIYAIDSGNNALQASLALQIEPGKGMVWSSVVPLVGTTTQDAERTAVQVAENYSSLVKQHDFKFEIIASASTVEGPSAGAAMALLTISILQEKQLPDYVSITGTINGDGSVGSVGGVYEKAEKAAETGIQLFMIPPGSKRQLIKTDEGIESINLVEFALSEWNLKVIEVSSIDEVLEYAFLPLNEIDVNALTNEVIPFIPEKVEVNEKLTVMKSLTERYLEEAKLELRKARSSLNNSLLEDSSLIDLLLSSINTSEQRLEEAEHLLTQNYFYSAANTAFLVKTNAYLVQDIADNPSILSIGSKVFELKLENLNTQIQALKPKLSSIPVKGLEWNIAAKQRITWAETNLEKINSTQTIIVTTNTADDLNPMIANLRDYEYAVGWLEIAEEFYEMSLIDSQAIRPSENVLSEVEELLIKTEDNLTVLTPTDLEDIERRLESAEKNIKNKWYYTGLMDAQSAFALTNSVTITQDKTFDEIMRSAENEINAIQSELDSSNQDFVWVELYLSHAKYFYDSANYYKENLQGGTALSHAKNALSVALLAKGQLDGTRIMLEDLSSQQVFGITLPNLGEDSTKTILPSQPAELQFYYLNLIIWITVIILILIVLLLLLKHRVKSKSISPPKTSKAIDDFLTEIDVALLNKTISQEKHDELVKRYKSKLGLIKREKAVDSKALVEIDDLKQELKASKQSLAIIRRHYLNGKITKKDFNSKTNELTQKTEKISKKITADEVILKRSKKLAQENLKELKKQAKSLKKS
ncbi:MAG: S16 family serine protease [archaeon]